VGSSLARKCSIETKVNDTDKDFFKLGCFIAIPTLAASLKRDSLPKVSVSLIQKVLKDFLRSQFFTEIVKQ
jgi:hypothetical protein